MRCTEGNAASRKIMSVDSAKTPHPAGSSRPDASAVASQGGSLRAGIRVDVALLALQARSQSLPGLRYMFGVVVVPASVGWQLPATHVRSQEPVSIAAARAADDACGLLNLTLIQVSTTEADGDDLGRVLAIGHYCGISTTDAETVLVDGRSRLASVDRDSATGNVVMFIDGAEVTLPAGQSELVAAALDAVRARYVSEPDPLALLPDLFTLADLKDAHDAVLGGTSFSSDAFRRVMEPQLIIVGERKSGSVGRPAKVYRRTGVVPSRPVSSSPDSDVQPASPMQPEVPASAEIPSSASPSGENRVTPTNQTAASNKKASQVDVQLRNVGNRRWLDELLSFASASMTVNEDSVHIGSVRFAVAADRTNERAIEQVLALVDKCQELFPHSMVDINARRGGQRQRRIDLRTTKLYLPYAQGVRQRLNELHDLAVVAHALIDIACASPDQLLRFNVNQILRDVDALELMLQKTSATGVVVHDVPDKSGAVPTAAEMEIRSRVPVVLNMAGAEAMAFRTISDRLGLLAEGCGSQATRVTERIWFVGPATA